MRHSLLFRDSLDRTKDGGHVSLEVCEFKINHGASRMKHHVDRQLQQSKLPADRFPHTPLDAIAVNCIAENLPDSKPNPRALGVSPTQRTPIRAQRGTQQEKVAHLFAELLAAAGVHALIIGMFTQPAGGNHKEPLGYSIGRDADDRRRGGPLSSMTKKACHDILGELE
jgi:hypothetical protein